MTLPDAMESRTLRMHDRPIPTHKLPLHLSLGVRSPSAA